MLYRDDDPVLGFSADSGYDDALYEALSVAPTIVFDARARSSSEHASFDEVREAAKRWPANRVFVTGYGTAQEGPTEGLAALRIGEAIVLQDR